MLKDPAPAVGTATLADSSIVIAIKPWACWPILDRSQAEINKAVVEAFREARIEIPFPQREIRLLPGVGFEIRGVSFRAIFRMTGPDGRAVCGCPIALCAARAT